MAPGGIAPGGIDPGGTAPGGKAPGGNSPGGRVPGRITPGGTEPGARPPGGDPPGRSPAGGRPPGDRRPGAIAPGARGPGADAPGGIGPRRKGLGGRPPMGWGATPAPRVGCRGRRRGCGEGFPMPSGCQINTGSAGRFGGRVGWEVEAGVAVGFAGVRTVGAGDGALGPVGWGSAEGWGPGAAGASGPAGSDPPLGVGLAAPPAEGGAGLASGGDVSGVPVAAGAGGTVGAASWARAAQGAIPPHPAARARASTTPVGECCRFEFPCLKDANLRVTKDHPGFLAPHPPALG